MGLWIMYWRNWVWPTFALAMLFCAMLVWPGKQWKEIKEDVTSRTSQTLISAGYDNIKIDASGRDLVLSGDVSASSEINKIVKLARKVSDDGGRIAPRIVVWKGSKIVINEPEVPMLVVNEPEKVTSSIDIDVLSENTAKFVIAKQAEEERINALPEDKRLCQVQLNDITNSHTINFASSQSQISAENEPLLDLLIEVLQACPAAEIIVEGHTDNSGDKASNLALSQKRAQAIVNYFRNNANLTNQITAKGFGETRPVTSNSSPSGKAKNRRIQFIIR